MRTVRLLLVSLMLATALLALVGCSDDFQAEARFIRYETLEDGRRIAVVAPHASGGDMQRAYTDIDDLEPGDTVVVRYSGKEWDQGQDAPSAQIVRKRP